MALQYDLFADPAPAGRSSGDSPEPGSFRPSAGETSVSVPTGNTSGVSSVKESAHRPTAGKAIVKGDRVVMLGTRHKGRIGVVTEVSDRRGDVVRVTLDGDGHRFIVWPRQVKVLGGEVDDRLATGEAIASETYTYSSPDGCPPEPLYDEPHDSMRRYRQVADEFRGVRIAREMREEEGATLPTAQAQDQATASTSSSTPGGGSDIVTAQRAVNEPSMRAAEVAI